MMKLELTWIPVMSNPKKHRGDSSVVLLHDRSHTVVRLPVHLPNQQEVEGEEREAVRSVASSNICLTAWFQLKQTDPTAPKLLYREIPEHYRWSQGRWEKRRRFEKAIGRMYTVSPREGERFYLRIMLFYTSGATSLESIKNVHGTQYGTFKEAASAAGYFRDDEEYRARLEEASRLSMPSEMRALFAYILSLCEVHNAESLWTEFKSSMIDDLRLQGFPLSMAEAVAYNQIKEIAFSLGVNVNYLITPLECEPPNINGDVVDITTLREEGERMYQMLNTQQKLLVDTVLAGTERCIFIDGPGGSGKTYVYNTLNNILRGRGKRVLNVAWSGIAATLLPCGQTVHSAFGLPVPISEDRKTSLMAIQSRQARELLDVQYIIWDEAPMAPKYAFDAVDKLLKNITELQPPQIPPVVPKAGRSEILNVSIKSSPLWPHFFKYRLTENVRASSGGIGWSNFLIQLGKGELSNDPNEVKVPDDMLSSGDIADEIFDKQQSAFDTTEQKKIFRSIDEVINNKTEANNDTEYSLEFLNSLTPQRYPPHELHLKKGAVIMLLRNLRVN
ncbi:unnamed protein product [Heligmosomoides polygyrus]|uniref:ATP-dependent DNA helicase n=1 Tax=Heligmosomoides polygyrus TaxID=6339 RepID=A0A183G9T9_HELPZ|nr:unnamed protein product [Heligmosomoides polygyrus]